MRIKWVGLLILFVAGLACAENGRDDAVDENDSEEINSAESKSDIEICSDSSSDAYDQESLMVASTRVQEKAIGQSFPSYPHCVREDGLGGDVEYCGSQDVDDHFYFFCNDPLWTDQTTGDEIERVEPCLWWVTAYIHESGVCNYEVVCVPEDRLDEVGFPDDAGFEYHTEWGPDLCEIDEVY